MFKTDSSVLLDVLSEKRRPFEPVTVFDMRCLIGGNDARRSLKELCVRSVIQMLLRGFRGNHLVWPRNHVGKASVNQKFPQSNNIRKNGGAVLNL